MKFSTTIAKLLSAGVLMAFACCTFAQQTYPSRSIRLIIPYPPGGGTTIVAHLLSQKLAESWGQPVIVDNRPGGNTIIGTEALTKLPPDGYTVLLASSTLLLNSLLFPVPYDVTMDFAPVTPLFISEQVLVMNPSVPANNLLEFFALAKSRPGQLNYATVSTGGTTHLAAESMNALAGIKTQQVNYKGAGPALTDLISGQVQVSFVAPGAALTYIKSGRLKALAISGEKRLPALPQVPTFTEAGLPGFDARIWFGVLARAGTPKEIVDKLSAEIGRIMTTPEMKEKLVNQAQEPFVSSPEQYAAMMKADRAKYARIIKTANIKIE